jgi:tetratricopeptide (TPR) repeat protein
MFLPELAMGQDGGAATMDLLLDQQMELGRISESKANERIKLLEAFIKKRPDSPLVTSARESLLRARSAYAESLLKQQRPEEAIEQFQTAFNEVPQPVSDKIFLNYIWAFPATILGHGFREEAILLMRRFEQSFWQQHARLAHIGLFYLNAETGEDAARVLERAIELEPNNYKYHQSMANARLMLLQLPEAKQSFQRAITIEPKEPLAYGWLAQLYRAEGAFEDAISLYNKQLEVTPEHESVHGGLAITHLLMKNTELAAAELEKQFAVPTRDIRLYTQLAYVAACRKDFARARRWAELALAIAPTYAWARIVMSSVLLAQQDYTTAEELLSETIARGTAYPTIQFELVKTLLLAENFANAFEQSERFLTITADGEFETRLGGLVTTRSRDLKSLLEKERIAALGLPESFTSDSHYRLVESFLRFQFYLSKLQPRLEPAGKVEEGKQSESVGIGRRQRMDLQVKALEALAQLLGITDERLPFRKLWAAEQLLGADIALERAADLSLEVLNDAEAATRLEGSIRDALELDRASRQKLFRARAEHLTGRVRFRQGQYEEAIKWFNLAVGGFSDGAEQRTALWHLAAATQAAGRESEALSLYIRSYNRFDENAALQRNLIEGLYKKVHGSLDGLDLK